MTDEIDNKLFYHSQVLEDLGARFSPHAGQVPIGKALFFDGKKRVFIECGRKFGKTDIIIYCLYRWCLLYPNSWCYYIAPERDQVKDLVWENGRMPYFLNDKLMKKYKIKINNTDQRVSFGNGSFIKCDGADNFEKGRGYSATGLSVYDEYKDHHAKFHDGFEPNLAITDAPLMIVGTPPDESEESFERWVGMADEVIASEVGFYINRPSMTNPHISKAYFERKYKELKAKGELWKWEKEYMAKRVKAGARGIFPMLDKEKHIVKYKDAMTEILNDHSDWDFFAAFDPGSAKCFAVIFGAKHRYSQKVIILDEIYATDFAKNSAKPIIDETKRIILEIMPDVSRWSSVYDHAGTWFWNEYQNNYDFGLFMNKCEKDLKNKENKLSLIKDMLNGGFLYMTDRCIKLFWEMGKYATDENGKIPKENDHAIDTLRYMLNDMNYELVPGERPKTEAESMRERRKITIQEDLDELAGKELYGDIDSSLYDY